MHPGQKIQVCDSVDHGGSGEGEGGWLVVTQSVLQNYLLNDNTMMKPQHYLMDDNAMIKPQSEGEMARGANCTCNRPCLT